jgi:hypothetical protein
MTRFFPPIGLILKVFRKHFHSEERSSSLNLSESLKLD